VLRPHTEADDPRLLQTITVRAGDGPPVELDATVIPGSTISTRDVREASSPELAVRLRVDPLSGVPVRAGDALRYTVEIAARGQAPVPSVRVEHRPEPSVQPVAGSVCLTCHAEGDECDVATGEIYDAISSANRRLREAEQLLDEVERAGMDVGEVVFDLNSRGQTAAIEAGALIHTFEPDRIMARAEDALAIADAGYESAEAAREEWQYRRQGLAVSLVLIALVLAGLWLKIRELDRRHARVR
jgi:hypothetical protein